MSGVTVVMHILLCYSHKFEVNFIGSVIFCIFLQIKVVCGFSCPLTVKATNLAPVIEDFFFSLLNFALLCILKQKPESLWNC